MTTLNKTEVNAINEMTPYDAIKTIKTLGHAKRVCEALELQRRALPNSDKDGGITYAYKSTPEHLKVGGVGYFKAVCLSHANKILGAKSAFRKDALSRFASPEQTERENHHAACLADIFTTVQAAA